MRAREDDMAMMNEAEALLAQFFAKHGVGSFPVIISTAAELALRRGDPPEVVRFGLANLHNGVDVLAKLVAASQATSS